MHVSLWYPEIQLFWYGIFLRGNVRVTYEKMKERWKVYGSIYLENHEKEMIDWIVNDAI